MPEDANQNQVPLSPEPAEVLPVKPAPHAPEAKNIMQVLQEDGLITAGQVDILQKESLSSGRDIEEILLSLKFVTDETLAQTKAKQLGLPYIDLRGRKIEKDLLDIISADAARNYRFIVFEKEDNTLRVALTNPQNFQALEALEFIVRRTNYDSQIYVTTYEGLDEALKQYGGIGEEVGKALETAKIELETEEEPVLGGEDLQRYVEQAPVSKAVSMIIQNAVKDRASDIHIEPEEKNVRVRYRVDGVLRTVLVLSRQVQLAIASRIKIMAGLKIDETRIPQDGRFHLNLENREIDFRISTLPTVNGEKVVLRILDRSAGVLKLETLGLGGTRLKDIKKAIRKSHGMFLVTGPTGAGKSTTLYSVLGILNEPTVNIITLEDPVEYFLAGISQSQINPEVGLSFASGLRSVLRQDPDIIMVGEIRDRETAAMAVHAALTGHIVLSTLHTNSSYGAIPRMIDMGIEPFLLASSLNVIVAQRLVRRLCPDCRKESEANAEESAMILKEWAAIPTAEKKNLNLKLSDPIKVWRARGCPKCKDGYRGRVGIFEVLVVDEKIQDAMLQRASEIKLESLARESGLITMMEDGVIKILQGQTTTEELLHSTQE